MNKQHKNYYSRGYLPHLDVPGLVQGITFRLADSLPTEVLRRFEMELEQQRQRDNMPLSKLEAIKRTKIEAYLDAGHGACYLRNPQIAKLIENALIYFDGSRYQLVAWVIMPNHVHVIIELLDGYPLGSVVHSWKSFAANKANKILSRKGVFWQKEYHDRYIRNEQHLLQAIDYVHNNPVSAGFVERPSDWLFSSWRFWHADNGD